MQQPTTLLMTLNLNTFAHKACSPFHFVWLSTLSWSLFASFIRIHKLNYGRRCNSALRSRRICAGFLFPFQVHFKYRAQQIEASQTEKQATNNSTARETNSSLHDRRTLNCDGLKSIQIFAPTLLPPPIPTNRLLRIFTCH